MNEKFKLIEGGVTSPNEKKLNLSSKQLIREMLMHIGENPNRDALLETPDRVVKSWKELYGGYKVAPKSILSKTFPSDGYDDLIICKNIEFYSVCEHHIQPIKGIAHIGYIPGKRIVGLSKLGRLVDCFSRRLQIQERLTTSIASSIQEHLNPQGVGVVIEATHFCMCARGVSKQNSSMVTSKFLGEMKDKDSMQQRFLQILGY